MSVPILVYQTRAAQRYAAFLADHGCTQVFAATTPEEAQRVLREQPIEVVYGYGFPLDAIAQSPTVRWVQLMSAGVDAVLRQGRLPAHITLTRMVGVFSRQMAEYVFAYLLHIEKDMERLRVQQQDRLWQSFRAGVLLGKTIGVAGLGSIGQDIVRKARAFDMTVYGISRSGAQAQTVDQHFHTSEWLEFVRDLDYLVLALPLTGSTHHAVDAAVLAAMKPGAVLVNVGRGASVDEAALATALVEGQLGGAVLDVFEQEPLPQDSPLWAIRNAYLTPHMSGPTTVENAGTYFLENLRRYERGEQLPGVVDWDAGY